MQLTMKRFTPLRIFMVLTRQMLSQSIEGGVIGHKATGEDESCFFLVERRQLCFKFLMHERITRYVPDKDVEFHSEV